jgi:protein gp37
MTKHNTGIEWTHIPGYQGESWNPVVGCSVISPGCTNCYAMRFAGQRLDGNPNTPQYEGTTQPSKAGPVWTGKINKASDRKVTEPLRWKKPRAVFVNSMGDLFHESVPDAWIDQVFAVMALCPQHVFIILTKRAERMRAYLQGQDGQIVDAADQMATAHDRWDSLGCAGHLRAWNEYGGMRCDIEPWPLPNVWLGVSVEDQTRADERIPALLSTPAAVRFLSVEPMLGELWLPPWLPEVRDPYLEVHGGLMACQGCDDGEGFAAPRCAEETDPKLACPHGKEVIVDHEGPWEGDTQTGGPKWMHTERITLDWIICGGESGKGARPMHPDWARSLRDQCAAAGVPFHFKQWGNWVPPEVMFDGAPPDRDRKLPVADWWGGKWDYSEDHVLREGHPEHEPDMWRVGKAAAGRVLDGRTHDEFPEARHRGVRND